MLFDTPKVKALKLNKGFDLALSGWGEEKDTQAYQTDIATFDLGGVVFNRLKAGYIPIASSPYFLREDEAYIDGVIGHDMLKHFVWEFDKSNERIAISQNSYQADKEAIELTLESFFSKITVTGNLMFNASDSAEGDLLSIRVVVTT